MRKLILFTAFTAFIFSCANDDESLVPYGSQGVVSSSGAAVINLEQIIFNLTISNDSNQFLLTPQLFDVEVYFNGIPWSKSSFSNPLDTSVYNSKIIEGSSMSTTKVDYLFFSNLAQQSTDTLRTVSDFAKFLNNQLIIKPGFYFAEIKRFKALNAKGDTIIYNTRGIQSFQLNYQNDQASFYIGEFNLKI